MDARNTLFDVLKRTPLAITGLTVGLFATWASLMTAFASDVPMWMLGVDGFTQKSREFLFPGDAFVTIHYASILFMIAFPICVLAIPTRYFGPFQWVLVRVVVFLATLSLDCLAVLRLFMPYLYFEPPSGPLPHAFEEIRSGLGPVERIVYGGLFDQAERGASSWVVVIHAVILTVLILIVFEILRWLVRRLCPSTAEKVSGAEAVDSQ